jgi:hypothetical protein
MEHLTRIATPRVTSPRSPHVTSEPRGFPTIPPPLERWGGKSGKLALPRHSPNRGRSWEIGETSRHKIHRTFRSDSGQPKKTPRLRRSPAPPQTGGPSVTHGLVSSASGAAIHGEELEESGPSPPAVGEDAGLETRRPETVARAIAER